MIRNRNLIFGRANNSSRDADKYVQLPEIANASLPTAGTGNEGGIVYDETNSSVYFSDGSSWSDLGAAGGSTAYDDIGNPDANGTIAFTGYTNTWTSTLDGGSVFTLNNTDADLSTNTYLVDLKLTDDGDDNGIFLRCLDNSGADAKFTVGANGATTIAGNAAGTDALAITAGDVTLTSGHLTMSSGDLTVDGGDIKVSADNQKVTFGAADSTDSYIQFDSSDLVFYDSSYGSEVTLSQLTAIADNPTIGGDVTISDGKLDWTDSTDETAATWSFAATTNNDIDWTSSVTTGKALSITADDLTSGDMVYLDSTVASLTTGNYIRCYDGSADDFTVAKYGAVTIAGNAATDVLTVTAGDVQITDGDIDLDDGFIAVDTDDDEQSYFARNNGTGTNAVVKIQEANTSPTAGVLHIDQDATGDADAVKVDNAGTGFAVTTTGGAAGSEGYEFVSAASGTGNGLLLDGTTNTWVGAASTGLLQAESDGTLADTTSSLARIAFSGTSASGGQGTCLRIEDTSTSGGGTEYAAYIASSNSDALYVDTGRVLMDEGLDIADSGTLAFGAGDDVSITSDGTDVHATTSGKLTVGDGGSSNYTQFASSTGKLSFAGTARPTKSKWFNPNDFTDVAGSPALTANGAGAGKGYALDAGSDEAVSTTFVVPDNWASGTDVSVYLYWATSDTNTNDVVFDVITVPLAEDEDSQGGGNTDSATDTAVSATAWDLNKTAAITVTASTEWAAGDMVILKVNRDADNGSDTIAADVLLMGAELEYTADAV